MRQCERFLANCVIVALLLIGWPCVAEAENWPAWRGPRGDGSSRERGIPTEWDGREKTNVAWSTALPGVGHASPIVWGDRVFLVSCRTEKLQRLLVCVDRSRGTILWERVVVEAPLEVMHRLNSHASSTPATDGRRVYVTFLDRDQMMAAAYDFDGNCLWEIRAGQFASRHGYCSSVTLFENLVILNGDHDGDAYLVALDRQTGATVWKTPREKGIRSYCAPLIREIGGRTQMVLSGDKSVASYDPSDGSRHWYIDGPTEQFVASLVYNGELFFMTAGFPDYHVMGIRPDGHGNVTDTHVAWHTTRGHTYVPSPAISDDGRYLLLVSDEGILSCFDAATGNRHWVERIGPHYSASPIVADGLVHFLSDQGVTKIIRPGPEFELVAENHLGEECYASPAVSQGCIYFRSTGRLICIGREPIAGK